MAKATTKTIRGGVAYANALRELQEAVDLSLDRARALFNVLAGPVAIEQDRDTLAQLGRELVEGVAEQVGGLFGRLKGGDS